MPSFDFVSEVDAHELSDASDQARREPTTRFDVGNVEASFAQTDDGVTLSAPSEFQLTQMLDILRARLVARQIDTRCMDVEEVEINLARAWQKVTNRRRDQGRQTQGLGADQRQQTAGHRRTGAKTNSH